MEGMVRARVVARKPTMKMANLITQITSVSLACTTETGDGTYHSKQKSLSIQKVS